MIIALSLSSIAATFKSIILSAKRRYILAFLRFHSLGVAWRWLLSNPEAWELLGHGLSELGVRHRVHDRVNAARSLC